MSFTFYSNWLTGSIVFIIMMMIIVFITQNNIALFIFSIACYNAITCYIYGVITTLDISDDDQKRLINRSK